MSETKPIPIRFSKDERQRLEEAAVLAGYKHVSAYIRDRALGKDRDDVEAWAARQEMSARLAALDHGQKSMQAALALILFLVKRKASTGDVSELQASIAHASEQQETAMHLFAALDPTSARLIRQLMED